jgi:hypothetical protein
VVSIQLSQAGFILALMAHSLVDRGGYSSQSIREAWRRRMRQKLPWGQTGGHADTTEAIERTLAISNSLKFWV